MKNNNRIVYIKIIYALPREYSEKNFKKEKRKKKEKKKKSFQFLNKHAARVQSEGNPPTLQSYVHKWNPEGKENKICIREKQTRAIG